MRPVATHASEQSRHSRRQRSRSRTSSSASDASAQIVHVATQTAHSSMHPASVAGSAISGRGWDCRIAWTLMSPLSEGGRQRSRSFLEIGLIRESTQRATHHPRARVPLSSPRKRLFVLRREVERSRDVRKVPGGGPGTFALPEASVLRCRTGRGGGRGRRKPSKLPPHGGPARARRRR